jgi:spectinomycin phosphotransferase
VNVAPHDLDPAAVAEAVRDGWRIEANDLTHQPVGFGTHHYATDDWFINVDDLSRKDWVDLGRSLGAAVALHEGGLEFVHAPRRRPDGGWLAGIAEGRYAVSVYDRIHGIAHHFGDRLENPAELLSALRRLHAAHLPHDLLVRDDLRIPHRDTLFDGVDEPWPGPLGEPARGLVVERRRAIEERLTSYDALAARVDKENWVVTHGEPHAGNVMIAEDGRLRLIDWDTAAIAPPERDLWQLALDVDTHGDPDAIQLYRLRWELTDVADYVALFKAPHDDDADTRIAWDALRGYLSS